MNRNTGANVYLVGVGPGDLGLVTLRARDIIENADVIVYDALINAKILAWARPDAELVYVGKIAGNHAKPQDDINALLVEKAKEGKSVARLKGGDPYIFGRGGEEAQTLREAGIPFEEVPGISSTIAAPAYAGIPLTHRDFVSQVTLITGHEREEKDTSSLDFPALVKGKGTLVFVMGMKNLPRLVEQLIGAGMPDDTPAALIYRGTTPYQRSLTAQLRDLPKRAKEEHFTNPSVIVVGKVVTLSQELNWFEQKPLFGRTIVVTRAREQASAMVAELTRLGANVLEFPTIAVAPCEDTGPLEAALDRLDTYQWIIFTSANGVTFFFDRLRARNRDSRALASCRIAAIGPATKETLSAYGIVADCVPARYVAEGLLEEFAAIKAREGTSSVLIPRAAQAREVLPERLRAEGFHVDVVPCYQTLPSSDGAETVREGLREKSISCITFTSSSTVTNFLRFIPSELVLASGVQIAAIGPITAKTAERAGLRCDITTEEYTIPALIQAITAAFSQTND